MSIVTEKIKNVRYKMKIALFLWLSLVGLACGAGATVYFVDGWGRMAILVAVVIVGAFVAAFADYKTSQLYDKQVRIIRIIYVATAVVATWPLLACVVSESVYLTSVAVTTIPLIGVCIRRALQSD